jgi:acyl-ACP thioesterase
LTDSRRNSGREPGRIASSLLVERPESGRTYSGTRSVRLGDVSPKGRLRLDALARYLQDVANDDASEALGDDAMAWVVRRTAVSIERFPVFREPLTLTTWASGIGGRWAERRTSVVGERGGRIEAASLWVHVDLATGRPKKLVPSFVDVYGEAAGGREISARLAHGTVPPDAARRAWTPRFADFDVVGHVNNAIYWAMVEEHMDVAAPTTIELEFRGGIDRGQHVEIAAAPDDRALWMLADGVVAASAQVTA